MVARITLHTVNHTKSDEKVPRLFFTKSSPIIDTCSSCEETWRLVMCKNWLTSVDELEINFNHNHHHQSSPPPSPYASKAPDTACRQEASEKQPLSDINWQWKASTGDSAQQLMNNSYFAVKRYSSIGQPTLLQLHDMTSCSLLLHDTPIFSWRSGFSSDSKLSFLAKCSRTISVWNTKLFYSLG